MSSLSSPPTSWHVNGSYFEACNCDAICPCRAVGNRPGGRSTHGICQFALSWYIKEGRADDVILSDLVVVMAGWYDDNEPGSPWRISLYIGDNADDAQYGSLTSIFLGRAGGTVLENFASAIGTVHEVRRAAAASAAGEAFGVSAVFSDHEQMVTQPDIDLVAVTVKVPHHRELVSAALLAGKAVYCEWPLGRDLDDARAMAALAAKHGVRTIVGLQARQAPAIELVQELLSDGYVGEVLSTTMIGLSIPGDVLVQPNAYMLDKVSGANLLTISVGHSLDILNYVLGEFAALSAVSDLRRPLITIEETGEQIVKTAADQIAVIGTLTSGTTATIHIREAVAGGIGFLWEINGTEGTLRITADAAVPEIVPLTVAGARGHKEPTELAVPAALIQKWPALTSLLGAPAYNVGRAYAAFAADIDNGTHTVPDFADAVRRHEVIAAIERSAASGERVPA